MNKFESTILPLVPSRMRMPSNAVSNNRRYRISENRSARRAVIGAIRYDGRCSLGAMVSLYFSGTYPDKVAQLVAIEGVGVGPLGSVPKPAAERTPYEQQ